MEISNKRTYEFKNKPNYFNPDDTQFNSDEYEEWPEEISKEDVIKLSIFDQDLNWINLTKSTDKINFENNIIQIESNYYDNSITTTNQYNVDEDSLLKLKKELKKEILEELTLKVNELLPILSIPNGIKGVSQTLLHTFQIMENYWERLWKRSK